MILSRGVPLFRSALRNINSKKPLQNVQARFGHDHGHASGFAYRDVFDPSKIDVYTGEFLGGVMWWWVLWNCWHMWGHIVGEFPYPEAEKWSDEELGITPD